MTRLCSWHKMLRPVAHSCLPHVGTSAKQLHGNPDACNFSGNESLRLRRPRSISVAHNTQQCRERVLQFVYLFFQRQHSGLYSTAELACASRVVPLSGIAKAFMVRTFSSPSALPRDLQSSSARSSEEPPWLPPCQVCTAPGVGWPAPPGFGITQSAEGIDFHSAVPPRIGLSVLSRRSCSANLAARQRDDGRKARRRLAARLVPLP